MAARWVPSAAAVSEPGTTTGTMAPHRVGTSGRMLEAASAASQPPKRSRGTVSSWHVWRSVR
jgi:hypothetical protein